MLKLIKIIILFSLITSAFVSFSQNDSLTYDNRQTNRYGAWLIPSASANIYGLAIGLVGSEAICNRPYTKFSHGLNFQIIGQGIFQTFYITKMKFSELQLADSSSANKESTIPMKAVHNGLILSPFGTFTDKINGVSCALWMSMGTKVNGLTCNLLWNYYKQINGVSIGFVNHTALTKGVQLGLINKTKKLKGVQIGLWNKHDKRSLPFINWNFKN